MVKTRLSQKSEYHDFGEFQVEIFRTDCPYVIIFRKGHGYSIGIARDKFGDEIADKAIALAGDELMAKMKECKAKMKPVSGDDDEEENFDDLFEDVRLHEYLRRAEVEEMIANNI